MKKLSKIVSVILSLVLCAGMASPALAAVTFDVSYGGVTINETDSTGYGVDGNALTSNDRDIIITGKYTETDNYATGSRITVGENVKDTTITLKDVNIDFSGSGHSNRSRAGGAALSITGEHSDVIINLEGENNNLKGGVYRAGLELNGGASVTVDGEGTLTATGGSQSAGIGSRYRGKAGNITISGSGTVNATGGAQSVGIGAGRDGTADNIEISGGVTVTARVSGQGTGIGAGYSTYSGPTSSVGNITISTNSSGSVTALGDEYGAGIGAGQSSKAGAITISGSGTVIATGGKHGAGIGTGSIDSKAGNITISGSATVTATGGEYAAGIGSGYGKGYGPSKAGAITISGSGKVTAEGGQYAAGIGSGYGMSYGDSEAGTITISCTANVTATGKEGGQDIGRGVNGKVGTVEQNPHDYQLVTTPASCTEAGSKKYTCKNCGHSYTEKGDPATGHNYTSEITREATCTEDGVMTYTCVKGDDSYTKAIPAKGHGEGVWTVTTPAQPGVPGVETLVCPDCGEPLGQTRPIPALPVPAIPDDGGADAAPDAATLADQEVPLAGLTPLYMLLEELRKYEEIPETELPEDFKWIDHAYAQAIYWGLQEELVVDTEEEPLDPDEVITVAILRDVLTNFVEYKGAELVVTLAGEDDEIVFDLGERLTVFYAELEAALTAKAA